MDGDLIAEGAPRFLGRKNEDRSDQPDQGIEGLMENGLRRAPPAGGGSVAIHSVLGDIDVEAAQIHGTKLVYPVVNFVKLILLVGFAALFNQLLKPRRHPSIDQGEIRPLVFLWIKIVEVSQQDPQAYFESGGRCRSIDRTSSRRTGPRRCS